MTLHRDDVLRSYLKNIKSIPGVENVVLTQRDGLPLSSAGLWLSPNEIFSICSAASAIYSATERLHGKSLRYILIESELNKFFISPLPSSTEFYIAITTRPKVNLGAIMVEAKESLVAIQELLYSSEVSYKPPLRDFSEEDMKRIIHGFKLKDEEKIKRNIHHHMIHVKRELSDKVNTIIQDLAKGVSTVKNVLTVLSGGYILAAYPEQDSWQVESNAAMVFSLFDVADRVAYTLKKTNVERVLCECDDYVQFLYNMGVGVFNVVVKKSKKNRLGLLRILLPGYVKSISEVLEQSMLKEEIMYPEIKTDDILNALSVNRAL
ncbi:MAG: hypothetical protein ACTSSJ_03210 [Candidatus Odinarchaeia archaeon]